MIAEKWELEIIKMEILEIEKNVLINYDNLNQIAFTVILSLD